MLTTVEAGRNNQRLTDEDQLQFATDDGRAIFSHNIAHFFALAGKWEKEERHHMGIIVCGHDLPWRLKKRFDLFFEMYENEMPDQCQFLPQL